MKLNGSPAKELRKACTQFMGKTQREIDEIATQTLEGHQRAIMGTMSVEDIFRDRKKCSLAVTEVATEDLKKMGIQILSYTIKDISDDVGYLESIGKPRTAVVVRDAEIGRAEMRKEAVLREQKAREQQEVDRFVNATKIKETERTLALKQAEYDIEVQTRKADADMAGPLQTATTKQMVMDNAMGVKVVEKAKQIQIQEQEIVRAGRALDANVKKPAAAKKYQLETDASGEAVRIKLEAEAEAEAIRLMAEAQAQTLLADGEAEAEVISRKAEAFRAYKDAAIVKMVLEAMPKIAAEVAHPLSKVNKVTMIAGADGEVGAARMAGEVQSIMTMVPEMVQNMTGIDLHATIAGGGAK